ncbi:2-hydroxyacyl-CoA dehydratase [Bacteroidota bacterium]
MAKYYDELFQLCGFEDEELNQERSRIEKVLQRLEMGPVDIERSELWVRQNHEIELIGLRKILRLWLKELLDLVLAKEEGRKLVYFGFPAIAGPAGAVAAASDEILATCPDAVLCHTMGQIFNNLGPVLEAGEENGLPPGHGLCSLQQVRIGGMSKGIIPVPDLVLTSSYYCDMGSKTDELLHERYGHPAVYVDGSMDSRWGDFPEFLPERVEFLSGQMERIFSKVQEVLGIEVTDEARSEGASRGRDIFAGLRELVGLMVGADPQPVSIGEVELARRLTIGSSSKRMMLEAPAAIGILIQEVKERIDRGFGVVEKGAPRVMLHAAHFSDPSIVRMMENCGISIPQTYLAAVAKYRRATPFVSGDVVAKEEMERGSFHGNYGLIKRAAEVIKDAGVDGVIWNYLFHCRPISQPAFLLKPFVEKETGIPVLALEFDLADSRTYSAGALRTRIETFAEMLRARKVAVEV